MKEIQEWIIDFYKQRGWTYPASIRLNFLVEELGELSKAIRTLEIGRDGHPEDQSKDESTIREEIEQEIGDVLVNLMLIADIFHLDLEQAIRRHKEKLENRFKESSK